MEIKELLAPGALILGWVTSLETRLRGKVSKDTCEVARGQFTAQLTRIESHVWDIMKAQGVTPTMEVPDDIKNNNK